MARIGIDIWMTTTAICGGFRLCQAFLGAKLHAPKDPGADLAGMLVQVLGTVFRLMETHEATWQRVKGSEPVPVVGFQYGVGLDPVRVDTGRMMDLFRRGVPDLEPVWRTVFDRDTMARLRDLASRAGRDFDIDDRAGERRRERARGIPPHVEHAHFAGQRMSETAERVDVKTVPACSDCGADVNVLPEVSAVSPGAIK